jgi:hypothetical protein
MTDLSREETSLIDLLLAFAGHLRVPVHERTVRIVPPRPDVQFEKCGQAEPVRAIDDLECLPLKHRRTGVIRKPRVIIHDELDTHQSHTALPGLVYQRLRPRRIDLARAYQSAADVVHAHGALVRTANAAKERLVTGRCGSVDVDELPRGVANKLNELRRGGGMLFTLRLGGVIVRSTARCEKRGGRANTAQQRETHDAHA